MSKLKACPFCGSDAELDFSSVTDYGNRPHQSGDVTCKNRGCDAEIGLYDFNPDDKSINPTEILTRKWNTRADDWISVDTPEDMPMGEEVLCWDGCGYHLDYADMDADTGAHYMANGTCVEAYKLLTPPKAK